MEAVMKNLKWLAILVGVCVLLVPGTAEDKKIFESKWAATAVQLNGNAAEWPPDALVLEKNYAIRYAFQNDAYNLYVLFLFEDPKFLSSIDATGLTMWINGEGKEKKIRGLRFYRKTVTADQLIRILEQEGQTLTEEKKAEYKAKPQYMLWASDILDKKGEAVTHPGIQRGTYRMSRSQKTAAYELVVPIALLNDPAGSKKWDPSQPLKIGFEWGGMTAAMRQAQAASIGDQGSRANAGSSSLEGQLSGGEGGDFNAPSASLSGMRRGPKKYDFWLDLKIAQNIQ
jgi:hypothetical protein